MLTAHGLFISTGNVGPDTHSIDRSARKSDVPPILLGYPPMRYVPTFSTVTDAALLLGCSSSPIRVLFHSWFSTSNTRHDAVRFEVFPPHVTIFEVGPVVAKVECLRLPEGKSGREQPVG